MRLTSAWPIGKMRDGKTGRIFTASRPRSCVGFWWITLLLACVEYDTGKRQQAETTRQAALSLGTEADHAEIKAWAHECKRCNAGFDVEDSEARMAPDVPLVLEARGLDVTPAMIADLRRGDDPESAAILQRATECGRHQPGFHLFNLQIGLVVTGHASAP